MDYRDKTAYSINNKVLALLLAGILILVNIISMRYFVRFDMTSNDQYSISDSSIEILNSLDDLVTVKAYFTSDTDLPAQFMPIKQYVRDMLGEYEAYSGGNLDVEFVDPAEDVDATQEAQRVGVQQVQMQVLENDSYSTKMGYMGIAMFYEGKTESMPLVQQEELGNLEYDVTSRILKLTQPRAFEVAFLQGHGEHEFGSGVQGAPPQPNKDYSLVRRVLSENYTVRTVDFSKGQTLENVDVLVVAGAQRDLSERDIFEIDQYMLNGGKAIFLVDAINQLEGINLDLRDTNLNTLFEGIGVVVNQSLVLDNVNELTNFSVGPGQFYVLPYPPFVKFVAQNFSNNPIVNKLESFVVRFITSLTVEEKVDTLTYDRFVNSSQQSWTQEFPFNLNPNGIPSPSEEEVGSSPVGVYVTGLFPRISDATTVPVLQEWREVGEENDYELVTATVNDENRRGRETLEEATSEGKLVVFSDSDFIADPALQNHQTGLVVFQNMVDFMTFGEELVNVRSKQINSVPLEEYSSMEKSLMKFLGTWAVPALLILYGVVRIWLRRREEKFLNV